MKLVVFSHKLVWENPDSPSSYATDGGFAFHMDAISQIFDSTVVAVPALRSGNRQGEVMIGGHHLTIYPLQVIRASGLKRKLMYIPWAIDNIFKFNRLINQADAVHVPIPSDIGTLGMLLAKIKGKPLFVRHCGNWHVQKTRAERFWKWFMEKYAGGKNVMLTTGLEETPPSEINKNIKWIFSSSLTAKEIDDLKLSPPKLDPKKPRIITVCRMDEEKGVRHVINAVNILRTSIPKVHLDVVGDGPDLPKFKALAAELKLENNVTFHGKLDHEGVIRALQNAHIFCFPTSASEGFPKVVLEALASGLPVIATPVSAIKALLKQGGGMILENNTAGDIAKCIEAIVHHPEDYYSMQQKALKTAKNFSLDNWRDTIKKHLEKGWNF
jgi:glycosyltransferase involved in cell wall biosynthesis